MEALEDLAVKLGAGAGAATAFRFAYRLAWRCRPRQALYMNQVHELGRALGMSGRSRRRALEVLSDVEFVAYRYDSGQGSGRLILLEVERRLVARFGLRVYQPATLRDQFELLFPMASWEPSER